MQKQHELSVPFVVSITSQGGKRCDMVFEKGIPAKVADFYQTQGRKITWWIDYRQIGKKPVKTPNKTR